MKLFFIIQFYPLRNSLLSLTTTSLSLYNVDYQGIMQPNLELEIEKETTTGRDILLSTSENIFNTRIETSQCKEYRNYKITEFSVFKQEIQSASPEDIWINYSGLVGESLFLLACQNSNIPIKISTGDEDWAGIDFYIFGYPVDVTTACKRNAMERKIDTTRYPTLFLPRFVGNNSIYCKPPLLIPYTKELFEKGSFDNTRYIDEMLQINYEVEEIIENEFFQKNDTFLHPRKAGFNNIHNMKTIMTLISGIL